MAVTDAPAEATAADGGDPPTPPTRETVITVPAWLTLQRAITFLTLLACVGFVFYELHPSLILADTTPAGGDMGAHVWAPAFLRDHLLPSLRLTGWTPDWYAGFPAFHFYMVLPSLAIVVLDVVLPYSVAFKLIAVSGLLALPVALYLFGRLAKLTFPGPQLLAVAGVGFLFDRSFSIYGGNVPSTLAGEFAFSISLAFAVVFLGVVLRGIDTGRDRWLAAVLFALTALCHLIPAVFAVVGAVIAVLLRPGRTRAWWLVSTGAVAGLLTAWWTVPFYLRSPYLNDMGWEKITLYVENLFPGRIGDALTTGAGTADVPGDMTWILVLALVGFGVSIALRRRVGIYVGVVGLAFAFAFVLAPQHRFWNARLLPFWYLSLYVLAALAVYEIAHALSVLLARDVERPSRVPLYVAPVLTVAVALAFLGLGLHTLPGGTTKADGSYSWLGFSTEDRSYIPDWARWNFSGYERKDAYPEYQHLVSTMAALGDDPDHGCGRAMWEYEPELDRFGTPMALMLLPYFTDECIGSMEGLYFEASVTTPYHFLMQSELSQTPSRAQRDLQYRSLDMDLGVQHMQLLGVKYYMAISPEAVELASAHDDLTEVATSDQWHVYEVADAPLVEPVRSLPAVVTNVDKGGRSWQDMAEAWYLDPSRWDTLIGVSGPKEWQRITSGDQPKLRDVDPIEVTNIDEGTSTISFDVSDVGTPVLVKTSYFPNWQASGAEGPWRVAPNFMVVVPTSEHVRLHYGRTPVDWLAWLLTFAGIGLAFVLWRRPALAMPAWVPKRSPWRIRIERVPAAADAAGVDAVDDVPSAPVPSQATPPPEEPAPAPPE